MVYVFAVVKKTVPLSVLVKLTKEALSIVPEVVKVRVGATVSTRSAPSPVGSGSVSVPDIALLAKSLTTLVPFGSI